MAFEVPWERYKDSNFVMHGWNEMVYDQKNWIGLNTGSFLTRELKNRPVFEANDQVCNGVFGGKMLLFSSKKIFPVVVRVSGLVGRGVGW
ncbi:hypothetical protein V6N13_129208 [Hibiscus sabdariffa]